MLFCVLVPFWVGTVVSPHTVYISSTVTEGTGFGTSGLTVCAKKWPSMQKKKKTGWSEYQFYYSNTQPETCAQENNKRDRIKLEVFKLLLDNFQNS